MTRQEFEDLREHFAGLEDISAEDAFRMMEEERIAEELTDLYEMANSETFPW